jgi:dethiobiotin synthetase
MKRLILLAALTLPSAVLAQTSGPTPQQLRTLQLRLNEQQQQLNQLRLRQPTSPQQDQQMRSLQNQLDQQQIELQRLKQQQESCLRGRC